MSLILKVANEATWADAKLVIRNAAKRNRVLFADRGNQVTVTNKESGDYATFKMSGGQVTVQMFEEGATRPYGSSSVGLSGPRSPDDWKERLVMAVEAVAL